MNPDQRSLADTQEELLRFVRQEHEARRESLRRLWARPVEERVEEGRCVVGGSVCRLAPPHGLVIDVPANDSRFREGDFVRVSRGNPDEPICQAVVVCAEDEKIELGLWGRGVEKLEIPLGCNDLQLDESAIDLERHFLGAIDDLAKTVVGRERILPLLAGSFKPKLNLETFDSAIARAANDGFDDEQAKAVASALACDLCWLIHGPPGTGKTRVLAWIASELLGRGERVLITSANHRTINNLLDAIAELRSDTRDIFKISPLPDRSLRIPQCRSFSETELAQSSGGYVIGATPYATRTRRLSGVDFDVVMIDEASQVTKALAVMAMLAGGRYILAGDHHQLPPVCVSMPPSKLVGVSIFGSLVGRGIDTMLTTTHRLNAPLCSWPSESFYLSRLAPSETAAARRFHLDAKPAGFETLLAPDPACVWLAVPHVGSRTSSPDEVEAVCELLLALRDGGCPWNNVGVVVPFRRQARLLRQRLRRHVGNPSAGGYPVADTVERMQGQEREVVIVSFATSDSAFAMRLADFLFQPQRVNVAATRPRTKLILVASPDLVEFARCNLPEESGAPFLSLFASATRVDWNTRSP